VESITDSGDQFLAHYGIPGMKWGRRSSKGSKGTASKPKSTATPFKKNPNQDPPPAKGVTDLRPKHIKRISDVELRQRLNRIQMETQYKELTDGKSSAPKSKAADAYEKFEKGHSAVKKLLAVAKTAQSIYKLYDSNEIRMLRGVESKEAEAERKNKDKKK
jgi:hypothetical protein